MRECRTLYANICMRRQWRVCIAAMQAKATADACLNKTCVMTSSNSEGCCWGKQHLMYPVPKQGHAGQSPVKEHLQGQGPGSG